MQLLQIPGYIAIAGNLSLPYLGSFKLDHLLERSSSSSLFDPLLPHAHTDPQLRIPPRIIPSRRVLFFWTPTILARYTLRRLPPPRRRAILIQHGCIAQCLVTHRRIFRQTGEVVGRRPQVGVDFGKSTERWGERITGWWGAVFVFEFSLAKGLASYLYGDMLDI
jgi:hypothetical protein